MKHAFLLSLAVASLAWAEAPQGYYRQPAIHGDSIIFVSEGDLWRVGVKGGVAQRLTTHPGGESYPAISEDGKTLAFIGQYEGYSEVYTMPMDGGLPVRQTFEAGSPRIAGWTPDGKVLYTTDKFSTLPNIQLITLDPQTHERKVLPLAQASDGVIDPQSGTIFFVRLPKQSSSTKRYRGGWVENLWRYKEGDAEATPLTANDTGTNRDLMWWQGRLYFTSDRDGVMNLWSMKPDGSDVTPHTKHADMDVKSPSLDAGRIAYQKGADLHVLDIISGKDDVLKITLASDFDQEREHWIKKPMEYLTSAHLSPNGDRVALTARGQVFVAPVESGRLVEVPRKQDVRYRTARFLPDGKSLIAQSDESSEIEFWKLPANGVGEAQRVSNDGKVFRFTQVPSLDGKWLAWGDKNQKFWAMNLETKETKLVAENREDEITDFSWSPDSQWLAYVETASNSYTQIKLFRVADGVRGVATSDRVNSHSPAWSGDGKWLYFLSERDMRTMVGHPWGPRQPEPFFTETTKIYQLALHKGQRSPFKAKDELSAEPARRTVPSKDELVNRVADEVKEKLTKPDEKKPDEFKKLVESAKAKPFLTGIDIDGLMTRIEELPVSAGNYTKLTAGPKYLYWQSKPADFNAKNSLKHLEVGPKGKANTLIEDMTSYELSADGKKMLVRKGDSFYVIGADTLAPAKMDDAVKLDGWMFTVSPREEWRQIFTESWRMMRDYFYDPAMHGIDWPAMRTKYLPLVDRVTDRAELSDIISEMIGELSTLHLFVRYGDLRSVPEKIDTASLGALLTRDEAAGGWKVAHIYNTDPDFPSQVPPLARPDANIHEGDIITRINGRPTLSAVHPDQLLRNQAGKQVLIEAKTGDKTHQAIVKPLNGEQTEDARYDEWEYTRRLKVDELGKGQIGYVHLRAMGSENIEEWARDFYPVFKRQGLIIDVRNNHGGNIDSWILEKLLRKAWAYMQPRVGEPYWNMQYAFRGHVTVICNQRTASDGEGFTEGFHRLGIGKVIGTRTWGGNVWLSAQKWLVDSGMATAAETGNYGPEGQWLIEGHGVDPDIVVDNLPHATFMGGDAQLEAAVKHLQELIAKDPRPVPPTPKYPVKK